ncbi:MAG: D-amino acid dehydrogenase [Gammaproteobacteria bacterium]|nr:D-amino acid dehydrogenase [Gammaproteobacteria bacterium]
MKNLIVGGGLLGLCTAHALVSRGEEVMLLERQKDAGDETSFANGGMLTPSMADPWNSPGVGWHVLRSIGDDSAPMLVRPQAFPSLISWGIEFLRHSVRSRYERATRASYALATYSLDETRKLRESLGLEYAVGTRGTMKVFRDQKTMRAPLALARMLEQQGMSYRVLDRAQVLEVEPQLEPIADELVGGLHFTGDESGDAHLFCRALAEDVGTRGANLRFGVEVKRLIANNGKVSGVETKEGGFTAERVIVAAGSYSTPLLKAVGLHLPVRPAKGYSITIDGSELDCDLPTIPVVDQGLHAAVTPLGQRIRVAGTAEFTGFDTQIRLARIQNLLALLEGLYPEIAVRMNRERIDPWAGLRPMSADGLPFIGSAHLQGLYLNTGHGALGWSQAMGSGKLLADLICGESPEIDSAPYRADRIRPPKAPRESKTAKPMR